MKTTDNLIDIYKRLRSCRSIEDVQTLKGNFKDSIGDKDTSTRTRKIEEVTGSSEGGGGENFEISGENRELGESRIPSVVELIKEVDGLIGKVKELAARGEFPHGVTLKVPEPLTVELPENELEGGNWVGYVKEILDFLQMSERAIIGVWGMGGVGKTSIVQHAYNLISKRRDIFGRGYWVTVSKDSSLEQLQDAIANRVGVDLSGELDEPVRAGKLSRALERALERDEKFVLFLDNMWKDFELTQVGIPTKNGCNLVLTSRLNHVCRKMDCQKTIKVEPLSEEDSWTLFLKQVGNEIPRGIIETARNVAKESAGLPLGIIALAKCMRKCYDIHVWSHVLNNLKNSAGVEDMEEKVFKVLRLSYERLNDSNARRCLLYCATYPENYIIPINDLIWEFIDKELLDESDSMKAMFDEGHAILNKLEEAALLMRLKDNVMMHDLIRDMALQIAGADFLVKTNLGLEAFPDPNKWTDKVVVVSLMGNDIKKMPDISPKCGSLSILLLQATILDQVRDGFFKHLHRLKVINLSESTIETLPESITSLKKLTSLILRGCVRLKSLPSLEKLTSLVRLDLLDTSISQVPSGLKRLINLRYLNLYGTKIQMIGAGVVRRLTALRYLWISFDMDVQELMSLNKLEYLLVHFHDVYKFSAFIKHMETSRSRLDAYVLTLGHQFIPTVDESNYFAEKCVNFGDKIVEDGGSKYPELPRDIQRLIIGPNEDLINLCELLSSPLHNLEHLTLESMFNLQSLFGNGRWAELSVYYVSFSNLKSITIYECDNLKTLFQEEASANLCNIEEIRVGSCVLLEEMIGAENGENGGSVEGKESKALTEFPLPKLKVLELIDLPSLKSLCRSNQVIHLASLEAITIAECPVLKRMPVDLHSQHRGFPIFRFLQKEEKWVQSLEWDPPKSMSLVTYEKVDCSD